MIQSWKKLSSAVRFKNQWWSYVVDTFQSGSGRTGEYNYIHTPGSVLIVPVLPDGRVVMISQYRYLWDRLSMEFPGGGVVEGETFSEAARKELLQEAGLMADELINIGQFCPFNGACDEQCRVFLALGLKRTNHRPEATEDIEMIVRRPDEIERMIKNGEIWDGQTLAVWTLVREKLTA